MCETYRYTLLATKEQIGKPIAFPEFPELKGTLQDVRNRLCGSRYNKGMRCFWEGDLEVTLSVNGKEVILNDHDSRRNQKTRIGDYEFEGEGVYVKDYTESHTYLIFSVCQDKKPPLIEDENTILHYNLGQPFIIELKETAGTGYSWRLNYPPEITMVLDTGSDDCEEGKVGCSRLRSFVLRGRARGSFIIRATYARPWEKDKVKPEDIKTYTVRIV